MLLLLVACGPAAQPATLSFPLTRAQCPGDGLLARLVISGIDAPCELDVSEDDNGVVSATGDCGKIPAGDRHVVRLQWYVVTPKSRQIVLLAEATGELNLRAIPDAEMTLVFADQDPSLRFKTAASETDTAAERTRFNCDRVSDVTCDSGDTPIPASAVDSCSNLQEWCKGTLFKASVDAC